MAIAEDKAKLTPEFYRTGYVDSRYRTIPPLPRLRCIINLFRPHFFSPEPNLPV